MLGGRLLMARKWIIGVGGAVVALVALDVSAYAFFRANGSGTGTASVATPMAVTLAAVAGGDSATTKLQPGGIGDVILRVSNPNGFAVTLVSVTGNGTITPDGSHSCATTGVTFTNQTNLSVPINPTGSGSQLVDLTGAVAMSAASSTGCQGATFSIPVTITVHR
jgi:hypothetical protein